MNDHKVAGGPRGRHDSASPLPARASPAFTDSRASPARATISSAMDPLSDLLRVVRLDGAFFYAVDAAEPWSAETVAARELSPRIMPACRSPDLVSRPGRRPLLRGLIGEEQVELAPGDVIVFPHGDAHLMSSERGVRVDQNVSNAAPARISLHPPPRRPRVHRARRWSAASSVATAGRSIPCWPHCRAGCTCGACRTPGLAASFAR